MKQIKYIFFFLLSLFINLNADYKIVGYYTYWDVYSLPPENIKIQYITHINYAFIENINDNGEIIIPDGFIITELNNLIHDQDKKILISIGGWGGLNNFSNIIQSPTLRNNFINSIINFCIDYDFDGIDLDWEFPSSNADKSNFTLLIKELRDQINEEYPELLITMAIPNNSYYGQWFDYEKLQNYVNWFNLMGYDYHGSWSSHSGHNAPLYSPSNCYDGSVSESINYLLNTRQINPNKLILGVPFYGKKFNTDKLYSPFTSSTGLIYKDIQEYLNNNWEYNWDSISKVPYLTNKKDHELITYDDSLSICIKTKFAINNQLNGIMIWALSHDSENYTLLSSIYNTIHNSTSIKNNFITNKSTQLKIFPNPFNKYFYISLNNNNQNLNIDLYNIIGQKILSKKLYLNNNIIQINISNNIPSGTYLLKLNINNNIIYKKLSLIK